MTSKELKKEHFNSLKFVTICTAIEREQWKIVADKLAKNPQFFQQVKERFKRDISKSFKIQALEKETKTC